MVYQGNFNRALPIKPRSREDVRAIDPRRILNTIEFSIDSNVLRRVHPAQPTGTQGEEGYIHGIGVLFP